MDAEKIDENLKKYLKGTTTLGLVCSDGVVLASDSRATMGYLISDKEARKIYQIDDKIAMTTAGLVGDNQALVRLMRAQAALLKLQGKPLTVKMASTLLSNILNERRMFPFLVQLIVGGYDTKGHVYELDPVGGISEKKMSSTGSGSPVAYGVLENEYKEGMKVDSAVKLAVKAMTSALARDAATGNHIRVVTITSNGYKELSKDQIEKIASKLKV